MVVHMHRKGFTDEEGNEKYLGVSKIRVMIDERGYNSSVRISCPYTVPQGNFDVPINEIRWFWIEED